MFFSSQAAADNIQRGCRGGLAVHGGLQPQPDLHLPQHLPPGGRQLHPPPALEARPASQGEAAQPGHRLDQEQQNILHTEQKEVRTMWSGVVVVEAQRNSFLISFCRVFTSNLNLPIICEIIEGGPTELFFVNLIV